jgi:DNA-binding GntR family transcriptional regulator
VTLAIDPPQRVNLAEQVYATLKAELHDFKWVAGERFSEAELGSRLGVSRTPVREALFRLRNEGFLDVEPKLGWFVKPIDFDKLEQLYDMRIVLELASVVRLCQRATDLDALHDLARIWLVPDEERLPLGSESAPQVGANDEAFHATLVRATGNAEMARVHWDVTERIRIVRRLDFTRADRIAATYTEHAAILRAVLARESANAQNLLQSHIEQSKAEVRQITLHMLHQARQQRQMN